MTNIYPKNNCQPVKRHFYTIDDCILPPDGTRIVVDKTVTYMGREYHNAVLARFKGQEVMVFKFEPDLIGICMGPELVCLAFADSIYGSLTEEQLHTPEGVTL